MLVITMAKRTARGGTMRSKLRYFGKPIVCHDHDDALAIASHLGLEKYDTRPATRDDLLFGIASSDYRKQVS